MKKYVIVKNGRGLRAALAFGAALGCGTVCAMAQSADTSAAAGSGIASAIETFTQAHPWLSTVLLAIGGLRVVFKPVMSILDSFIKSNCPATEYAKLQNFESGAVYKWLNFGLDFVGSIKLPVLGVKPSATASGDNKN